MKAAAFIGVFIYRSAICICFKPYSVEKGTKKELRLTGFL